MLDVIKKYIIWLGVRAGKTFFKWLTLVILISLGITYSLVDRQKLAYYIVTFAINQLFYFFIFGAGLLSLINIYISTKVPLIVDEIFIRKNKDEFSYAYIFTVLNVWETKLKEKPFGFNSMGKELLIRDFIYSEIKYIEFNLAYLFEDILQGLSKSEYSSSAEICAQFRLIFITKRLNFKARFGDDFTNKLSIDPEADIPRGKRKEILQQVPVVIFQKYINSSANFNIFLDNSFSEIARQDKNRYETLKDIYSDFVKAVYSYKDNILPNFREEFNGDLSKYHLLYQGCKLSEDEVKNYEI